MNLFMLGVPVSFRIGTDHRESWMTEGVYLTEQEAIDNAKPGEMLLEITPGRCPENATDAVKLYWPLVETWEQSALYKLRNPNKTKLTIVKG